MLIHLYTIVESRKPVETLHFNSKDIVVELELYLEDILPK